jgi:hypothetical protein
VRIPRLFGGRARDRAIDIAATLRSDATQAVQLLGPDPARAPHVQGLLDVIAATAALTDPDTSDLRLLRDHAMSTVQVAREHLLTEVAPSLDSALPSALGESPRTVDPARVAVLMDVVDTRTSLGAVDGRFDESLRWLANETDPGRAELVRSLTAAHLDFTGQLDDVPTLSGRARELLDGGLDRMSAVDAAELDALLTRTPLAASIATDLPELAGSSSARITATIRNIVDGTATEADRRLAAGLVAVNRGAVTSEGLQAIVLDALGTNPRNLDHTKLEFAIELLDHPTARSVPGTDAMDNSRPLVALLKDYRDGYGNDFQLGRALQRFALHADGTLSDPIRLRDATRQLLTDSATLDAADLGRLAALVDAGPTSPAGLPLVTRVGNGREFGALVADRASGYGSMQDVAAHRYVQGMQLVLDGTMDEVGTRAAAGLELFGRSGSTFTMTDLGRVAAFADLMPAGAPYAGPHRIDGMRTIDAIAMDLGNGYGRAGVDLERYLEAWRLAIDGTTQDPSKLRLAALEVLGRDPMSLDEFGWGRVAGMVDSLPDTPQFAGPRRIAGMRSLTQIATDLGQGYGTADARTSRYLDAWMMHLDGTASDPDRIRAAAVEVFSRDPAHFTVRDWGMVAALQDLDPDGTIIGAPQVFTGKRPLGMQAMDLADGYGSVGGTMYRHFHGMRMAADGTGTDPERLFTEAHNLLRRDPTTFTTSDWGKLAALVDVDTGHRLPLHEGTSGGRPIVSAATDIADGYGNGGTLREYFDEWLPRLDPNYVAKRRAALEAAIAGGPIPERARLAEFEALESFAAISRSQRASIGGRLLEHVTTTTVPGARTFLDDVQAVLRNMDGAPPQLQPVRTSIDELVELNVARINGRSPRGAVRGYSNHPDYAELGRIRANLSLLAKATAPRPAAPAAASAAAPAAAPTSASTAGAEILTW